MDATVTEFLTYLIKSFVLPSDFKPVQIVSKVFQSWVTVLMRKCVDVKPQRFDLW